MPDFKLPLSGDVSQQINPMSWFLNATGGQWGCVNINLGRSRAPEVEQEILSSVGSYGRQMGKICEVLRVLVKHIPENAPLAEPEKAALREFARMLEHIDDIKESFRRSASRAARED